MELTEAHTAGRAVPSAQYLPPARSPSCCQHSPVRSQHTSSSLGRSTVGPPLKPRNPDQRRIASTGALSARTVSGPPAPSPGPSRGLAELPSPMVAVQWGARACLPWALVHRPSRESAIKSGQPGGRFVDRCAMLGDATPSRGKLVPGSWTDTSSGLVELGSHRAQTYWHHILRNNRANEILLTTS